MQEINPNDIRLVAMNLLARREHLRSELSLKLRQRFAAGGDDDAMALVEPVLDQLAADNLQSDERYTESYIRSRSGRGYGPDRIRQELRQKGVDAGLLDEVLASLDLDWVALAAAVRAKKFRGAMPTDFREKAKQLRFLNYRGFGAEYATAALESIQED